MMGNLLAPVIGWRAAFMVSAAPALLVVLIRTKMPESDVWLLEKSREASVGVRHAYGRVLAQMIGPALRGRLNDEAYRRRVAELAGGFDLVIES